MKIKGWNSYEIIWLILFIAVGVYISVSGGEIKYFDLSVFISGIFCVVLAAKGSIWTYIFGMYNSLGYAYMSYTNGLFGEMGLNLFFFMPTNIIGLMIWRKKMSENVVIMRALSNKNKIITGFLCVVGIVITGFMLSLIKGQNSPYIDATTNTLSIIATLLMIWRYKEQWILYIILNIFTIIMWSIRMANGSPEGPIMIVMWSSFLVNAMYGYYNWSKGAKKEAVREEI